MTVPFNDAIDIYTAAGGEPSFSYTFPVDIPIAPAGHEVIVQNKSGGLITTLVENVDYTVTGAGNPGGGLIVLDTGVFPSGAVAGIVWTVFRQIIIARPTDFQTSGDFFALDVNLQMDKHTKIMQDIQRDLGLSIALPTGSGLTGVTIPLPGANEYIKWNASGTNLVTESLVTVGTATGVDETDTDASKTKMTSNLLAKKANDTAECLVGVQVASFANRLQITQALTTVSPKVEAIGSDTNIGWDLRTKGSGAFDITGAIAENKSADIVTTTTMNVSGITGNYFHATGNNTVNGFTGRRVGFELTVKFTGTPTLTHNATSFILEGGANIIVPAGSVGMFRSLSLSPAYWQMVGWMSADGLPIGGLPLPADYISGFDYITNVVDATNDFDFGPGSCRDDGDTTNIVLAAGITKQIDAAWAVGTNQGAYESAAGLANNTSYHVHVVKNLSTGVVDIAIDISPTAANFHAAQADHVSRRIGSVRRDTAANRTMHSIGGEVLYGGREIVVSGALTTGGATLTLNTPPDVECIARLTFSARRTLVGTSYGLLNSLNAALILPTSSQHNLAVEGDGGIGPVAQNSSEVSVMTNKSNAIRERVDTNASTNWVIQLHGYYDYRGRK